MVWNSFLHSLLLFQWNLTLSLWNTGKGWGWSVLWNSWRQWSRDGDFTDAFAIVPWGQEMSVNIWGINFIFWLSPQHAEVLRPGIEPIPQQWPKPPAVTTAGSFHRAIRELQEPTLKSLQVSKKKKIVVFSWMWKCAWRKKLNSSPWIFRECNNLFLGGRKPLQRNLSVHKPLHAEIFFFGVSIHTLSSYNLHLNSMTVSGKEERI